MVRLEIIGPYYLTVTQKMSDKNDKGMRIASWFLFYQISVELKINNNTVTSS